MTFGALRQTPRGNTGNSTETAAGSASAATSTAATSWWRRLPWPSSLSSPSPPWSSEASAGGGGNARNGSGGGGSNSSRRKLPFVVAGNMALTVAACAWLGSPARLGADGQPDKYMTAAAWKDFLSDGGNGGASWFARWNAMAQPRIDQLVSLAEAESKGREDGGTRLNNNYGNRVEPFRVTMVGDSTMMQQHGVICAFLGERPDRRFDPAIHQEECCIDTLPRHRQLPEQPAGSGTNDNNSSSNGENPGLSVSGTAASGAEGGRGLCFRHAFQRFAAPPDWESELGSPDAVYFGSGLHFLHMARPGHGLEPPRVQGWLTYEKDLEHAVETYRAEGGDGLRLVFTTSHTIQDSVYEGDFKEAVQAYRNNDAAFISICENQVQRAAGSSAGPEGYGADSYCRQALMDRNGSEVLNRRSRSVMERLAVPLVEGDLIVKDQAWATPRTDGRHYHMLVPVEVWDLLGVLVSPFENGVALESAL